jgi:hypothetical protein
VVALILALVSLSAGTVQAYSSLFGSLAVYLPGLVFTALVMRKMGGDSGAFLRTAICQAGFDRSALCGGFHLGEAAGGRFFFPGHDRRADRELVRVGENVPGALKKSLVTLEF